jgi:hypothetical protein
MNVLLTLDAIAADPRSIAGLPAATLAALSMRASAVQGAISAQLLATGSTTDFPPASVDDEMLTPIQAAELLKQTPRWLSRNRHRLPFVKSLSPRRFVCSRNGIMKWLGTRRA